MAEPSTNTDSDTGPVATVRPQEGRAAEIITRLDRAKAVAVLAQIATYTSGDYTTEVDAAMSVIGELLDSAMLELGELGQAAAGRHT